MIRRRLSCCRTFCLPAICLLLAGCQISLFGLGPTLDQAVTSLSTALGIELKMVRAPEKVRKFDRWVSQGGPPNLVALGPAKGPAAYTLTVALGPDAPSRLVTLLDVIVPEWNDRKAWLPTALRQLQSAPDSKSRIRMNPSGNRVVVLMVDKPSNRAALSIMTLVWSDYAQGLRSRSGAQ